MSLTKKLCAIVLSLVLLISCMSVFTVSAATSITPTGVLQHDTTQHNDWRIWLEVGETIPDGAYYAQDVLPVTVTDKDGNLLAKTGDGKTFAGFLHDGIYLMLQIFGGSSYTATNQPQDGDTIVIAAGTYDASNTANSIVIAEDITLEWNGSNWSVYVPDTTVYTELNPTGMKPESKFTASRGWDFYLTVDGTIPGVGDSGYQFSPFYVTVTNAAGTVLVDNQAYSFTHANHGPSLFFYIPTATLSQESVDVGTKITIAAGKAKPTKDCNGINLLQSITMEWNGSNWSVYVPDTTVYTEYTGTFTNADSQVVQGTDPNQLYLKGSESLAGAFEGLYEDGVWNKAPLTALGDESGFYLNGEKVSVAFQQYTYSSRWYFASGMNAASAGDVLTLKGTFVNEELAVKINVEECKFIWDGTKWSDYVPDTTVYTELNPTGMNSASKFTANRGWDFYLTVDGTIPGVGDDGYQFSPFYVTVTNAAGTVLVNNQAYSFTHANHGPSLFFYIPTATLPQASVDVGTKITIAAGKAKPTKDCNGINLLQSITMEWNGSNWSVYVPDTTVYDPITFTGSMGNTWTAASAWWDIYYLTNEILPGTTNSTIYSGLTVEIDGVAKSATIKKANDKALGVFTNDNVTAPVAGTTIVTLKAGKGKPNDDSHGISIAEDVKMVWNGTTLVPYVEDTTTYNDTTITGIHSNTNLNVYLYLNTDVEMPGGAWGTIDGVPVKWDQKITINGTAYTVTAKKWDTYGLFIEFPSSYLTASGDVITVKAGKYKSNVGDLGYNLTADYVLTYTGSGFVAGEIATTELTFTALTVNTAIKADGSAWQLYMTPSTSVPGAEWGGSYHQIVTVDGVESTLTDVKNGGGTGWYATVPTSVLPLTGEHTLVLKAGWYKNQTEAVAYYLPADVTLYTNKYGISLTGLIAPTTAVSPTLSFAGPENSENGLNTTASADDGTTYDGSWQLTAYAGGLSADGQTRFLGESGFYLNGVQQLRASGKYTGIMKKLGTKTYYIGLLDMGVQGSVTAGAVLTVKGLFHNQYGEMVEIAESNFVWDGTTWANQVDRSDYTEHTGKFFIGTPSDKGGNGAQITTKSADYLYLKGSNGLATVMNDLMIAADHIASASNTIIDDGNIWNVALFTAADGANNGVFLNETKITVSFQKYQYLKNWWYMGGINATAVGDTLVIKGQFYNDAAKVIVNVTESTFKWDGEKWIDVLTTTKKYDINADGLVTALDATLLERYLADNTIAVSNMADVNGDGSINAEDQRILRRYILGIEITVVDGVAYGTPYYAGGEMMKVAYSAPSIGSFDSATGVVTFKSDEEIDRLMDEYAKVGFTHIVTEFVATLYDNTADYAGQQLLYRYYEEAAERGMKVIVTSQYMDYLRNYADDLSKITYENGNTWKDIVDDIITKQMKYEAFWGFMFGDEPTITALDRNAEVAAYVRSKFPTVNLWWACFPDYVDADAVNSDYAAYVAKSGDILGHFMYDNYGLRVEDRVLGSDRYYIEDNWFTNLQTVADEAKKGGFTAGVTMQAVALDEQGGGGWFSSTYQTREIQKKADIGFQIYTALAYGMKELDFFTYAQHPNASGIVVDTAMLKSDGTQNSHYTWVKEVYANISEMEKALLNFSWEGTITSNVVTGNKNTNAFNSSYTAADNSRLNTVSVSGKALIGCMKDKDGFDGYLIANAAEPYNGSTASVTVTFNSASKALVYWADGTVSTVALNNGAYTFTVGAGEGVFVIPLV